MVTLILHPLVDCDREAALLFYYRSSEKTARAFDAELEQAWRWISENPRTWPQIESGLHRYLLQRFPYAVIYLPRHDHAYVVAIVHLSRQPGYWHDRLSDIPES